MIIYQVLVSDRDVKNLNNTSTFNSTFSGWSYGYCFDCYQQEVRKNSREFTLRKSIQANRIDQQDSPQNPSEFKKLEEHTPCKLRSRLIVRQKRKCDLFTKLVKDCFLYKEATDVHINKERWAQL